MLASEDSYGPGGFNMGVLYNVADRKAVPIVGAITGRDIIVNNQMKGSAGPMREGFYYSSQTHFLQLPTVDWTGPLVCPSTIDTSKEDHWITAYGRFRRKLSAEDVTDAEMIPSDVLDDWHLGHEDLDSLHH